MILAQGLIEFAYFFLNRHLFRVLMNFFLKKKPQKTKKCPHFCVYYFYKSDFQSSEKLERTECEKIVPQTYRSKTNNGLLLFFLSF